MQIKRLSNAPEITDDAEMIPKNKYRSVKYKYYDVLRESCRLSSEVMVHYVLYLMDDLGVEKDKFEAFSYLFHDLFMRQTTGGRSVSRSELPILSWAKKYILRVQNSIFPIVDDNHWKLVIVANVDSFLQALNKKVSQDAQDKKPFLLFCDLRYSAGTRFADAVRIFLNMVKKQFSSRTEVEGKKIYSSGFPNHRAESLAFESCISYGA